jgi:glycosyltransferase involved in cell wall biosynthesis
VVEVGISGLALDYPHSGTAVYIRHLVPLLPHIAPEMEFRLFTRWSLESFDGVRGERLVTPAAPCNRGAGVGAQVDKLLWETGSLPVAARLRREAMVHSPTFTAPVGVGIPVVVTVHDVIPLVLPGYHRSRQARLYSRLMAATVRRASAIITVSEWSRRDIVRVLGVPEERVTVTYEAADPRMTPDGQVGERDDLRRRYGVPHRFALYVGGAERRKNIELLVRAWAVRRDAFRARDLALVLVADFPEPDALYPDIPGLVRELGLGREVMIVRGVEDEDMPALYRAAELFCFPSMYEGFGLTPLEAMASGTPVLCSNATSLREVVGDGARLLPPADPRAWADAVLELADSDGMRRALRERGVARASGFSWHRTAEETVQVYRRVLRR